MMPPTLITSDRAEVEAFRAEHRDIIVKPLFGNGGAGVFHLGPDDENLSALLELFTNLYREPIIVQRYLPEVRGGDKRKIGRASCRGRVWQAVYISGVAVYFKKKKKNSLTHNTHVHLTNQPHMYP